MIFNGVIEGADLLSLVPHRGKMLMLSRITGYDTEKRVLRSEYDIDSSCLFYDKTLAAVPAWVSFEFMAQSISALSGLCAREQGKPTCPGVILSLSNLAIFVDTLTATCQIEVVQATSLDAIFTFDCTVFSSGKKAVTVKLTVMDVKDLSRIVK